jgi:hypothetical protein
MHVENTAIGDMDAPACEGVVGIFAHRTGAFDRGGTRTALACGNPVRGVTYSSLKFTRARRPHHAIHITIARIAFLGRSSRRGTRSQPLPELNTTTVQLTRKVAGPVTCGVPTSGALKSVEIACFATAMSSTCFRLYQPGTAPRGAFAGYRSTSSHKPGKK